MVNSIPDQSGWLLDEYDQQRFWVNVSRNGGMPYLLDDLSSRAIAGQCWIWNAAHDSGGYGVFKLHGVQRPAHRIAFRDFGYRVDGSQVIDHLCRNTGCVNPSHLEPVAQSINIKRGLLGVPRTDCKNGHPLTPDSTNGRKARYCRICLAESKHRTYLRRKAAGKLSDGSANRVSA